MLSNTHDFHGSVGPSNDSAFFQGADSQFGGLLDANKIKDSTREILEYARKIRQILRLPRRPNIKIKFVDYDNTLSDDERRFQILPDLRQNRGEDAYPIIQNNFGNINDPSGFEPYILAIQPYKHMLKYKSFYNPEDPNHVILTAGNYVLQKLKIENSGFKNPKFIIVNKADKKIRAIMDYILELGYIPGGIEFIDDKIRDFNGIDQRLSQLLGIEVIFFQAIPQEDKSVRLLKITQSVQSNVEEVLASKNHTEELLRA